MLATCPALASGDAFLGSLLRHIDCQGRALGATGYEALAAPTSPIGVALTSILVIFVALFGMRMALGGGVTLRNAVEAVVKIGIVLTLATSWPAFQVVIYDVVVNGPEQLARAFGFAPEAAVTTGLIDRLQAADQSIIRLTNLGTGREAFAVLQPPGGSGVGSAPQRFPISDDPAFGWARVSFVSSSVAALAAVRLVAGVLLALAPLFAAFLLFDIARGLFVSWCRALFFTVVASAATSVLLNVELALLEPWINSAISLRSGQTLTPTAPVELLILCLSFAAALLGSLAILLRMSFMSHMSFFEGQSFWRDRIAENIPSTPPERVNQRDSKSDAEHIPSRALLIADSVTAAQRREASQGQSRGERSRARPGGLAPIQSGVPLDDLIIPDFGSSSRRSRLRTSLGSRLRDYRS